MSRLPLSAPALAAALIGALLATPSCGVECHETDVRFEAVLPERTFAGPAVLQSGPPGDDPATGAPWTPKRTEGTAELVLTIRADVPVALSACADPEADTGGGPGAAIESGDARGATALPFAPCFWLEPATPDEGLDGGDDDGASADGAEDGAGEAPWTLQVGVATDLVYVFGENTTVDPREGCPPGPMAEDFAWTLSPAEGEEPSALSHQALP